MKKYAGAEVNQTVLHENVHGIQMIRQDYVKRSKVTVANKDGRYTHIVYRFNKIQDVFDSPYISWANLDCCNGWHYDSSYLESAVQQGKKLYAGEGYAKNGEDGLSKLESIQSSLPEGIIAGIEESDRNPNFVNIFICREGVLSDYYNLEDVFNFYAKLGLFLPIEEKEEVERLCSYEIRGFSRNVPFDYANPKSVAEFIVVGLLLGYPIESTCSLLQGF